MCTLLIRPPKFKIGDAVIIKPFKVGCSYCFEKCDQGPRGLNYIWIDQMNKLVHKIMYIKKIENPTLTYCPRHTYVLGPGLPSGFNEIWLEKVNFLDDNLFEI